MCLVLVAYKVHPGYPLVIAANRDEFYQRPASSARYWEDHPQILGGRDLQHGGTWMAVDRRGRMAAVTNYREPSERKQNLRSRGFLVTDYLFGDESPHSYLRTLSQRVREYDGFNIFAGDTSTLYFYGSYLSQPLQMQSGIHGISNGDLDYPWPKVDRGKRELSGIVQDKGAIEPESLFEILRDRAAPDEVLPPGGGPDDRQKRRLTPIFVTGGDFGTRSSTVLLMDSNQQVYFSERNFDAEGRQQGTVEYEFEIERT